MFGIQINSGRCCQLKWDLIPWFYTSESLLTSPVLSLIQRGWVLLLWRAFQSEKTTKLIRAFEGGLWGLVTLYLVALRWNYASVKINICCGSTQRKVLGVIPNLNNVECSSVHQTSSSVDSTFCLVWSGHINVLPQNLPKKTAMRTPPNDICASLFIYTHSDACLNLQSSIGTFYFN